MYTKEDKMLETILGNLILKQNERVYLKSYKNFSLKSF